MDFNEVFKNATDVAFRVFESLIKDGKYIPAPSSSGWGESGLISEHPMDVIPNGLTQDDLKNTSFFAQIQPTDTVIMVKGVDITGTVKRVRNADSFQIFMNDEWKSFTIIDHETDPAEALFLILLREK